MMPLSLSHLLQTNNTHLKSQALSHPLCNLQIHVTSTLRAVTNEKVSLWSVVQSESSIPAHLPLHLLRPRSLCMVITSGRVILTVPQNFHDPGSGSHIDDQFHVLDHTPSKPGSAEKKASISFFKKKENLFKNSHLEQIGTICQSWLINDEQKSVY